MAGQDLRVAADEGAHVTRQQRRGQGRQLRLLQLLLLHVMMADAAMMLVMLLMVVVVVVVVVALFGRRKLSVGFTLGETDTNTTRRQRPTGSGRRRRRRRRGRMCQAIFRAILENRRRRRLNLPQAADNVPVRLPHVVLQVAGGLEGHVAQRAVLQGDPVLPQVPVEVRLVAGLVDAEAAAVLLGQQLGVELRLVVRDGVGGVLRHLPPAVAAVTPAPQRARRQEQHVLLQRVHHQLRRTPAALGQKVQRVA